MTTRDQIRHGVAQAVTELSKTSPGPIDWSRWASDYGIDSLALLVFREVIERRFEVHISDAAWLGFVSLEDVVVYVQQASPDRHGTVEVAQAPAAGAGFGSGAGMTEDGLMTDTLEVGMPMTGQNNMAENPLLKYLGHLRWAHLSAVCGIRSRDIVDAEGHRLYPTFFFVDLQFPQNRHMGTFTENERMRVVCTLRRFGGSMLDGYAYLVPEEHGGEIPRFTGIADAVAAGIPAARLSNIFVKQFGGAEWLKKSRPASAAFERVQEALEPPDSYTLVKSAERDGYFEGPPSGFVPLTRGPVSVEYRLVPERDLNGAGLVYFANYPLFLDICERQALSQGPFALGDALLNKRALVRRRSAYLNNASAKDTVAVEIETWLQSPTASEGVALDAAPIRLFTNYRMRRLSDGRVMMVSSAEKLITGHTVADLPFVEELLTERRTA